MKSDISRFLDAQNQVYLRALSEIMDGKKTSHWMWYIFPQLKGLGHSDTAIHYSLRDIREANEYYRHPVLGQNLIEISNAVYRIQSKTALDIFGSPDDLKLRSCMTLFSLVEGADPIFENVLTKYFGGRPDKRTLELLEKQG